MAAVDLSKPFQLNDIVIDPINNKVIHPEKTASAPHKLIKLLQYFAANANRVVTNDELSEHVWDGVVSEGTRYSQIANLRKLLNDNPSQPKYLKTVPRKGYMFIAEVSAVMTQECAKEKSNEPKDLNHTVQSQDVKTSELQEKQETSTAVEHSLSLPRYVFVFLIGIIVLFGFFISEFVNDKPTDGANTELSKASKIKALNIIDYDYQHLLSHSQRTILINTHIPSDAPEPVRQLLTLGQSLLWYHLESLPSYRLNFAPIQNPSFRSDRYIKHFESINPVCCQILLEESPLDEKNDEINQNSLQLTIHFKEKMPLEIKIPLDSEGFGKKNIQQLESKLSLALHSNFDFSTVSNKPLQFQDDFDRLQLEDIPFDLHYQFYREFNPSYTNIKSLVIAAQQEQPSTSFLRTYLLESYIHFLHQWGNHFEFELLSESILPLVKDVLQQNPQDVRALTVMAYTECIKEKTLCPKILSNLIKETQTLDMVVYLMHRVMHLQYTMPLDLARYAYEIRPRYGFSNFYFYYFYAALSHVNFDEAQAVAEAYNYWGASQIQVKKSLQDHQTFQRWYQDVAHAYLGKNPDDIYELGFNLDMTFLSFSLLDANQPELAQQWISNSGEIRGQMEADPMIQLWTGEWEQLKWMALSTIAKTHLEELQVHDQWRMAYLELRAGLPKNALLYLEQLAPELFQEEPTVHLNNVRLAVYLIEALKGTLREGEAQVMVEKVQQFLESQHNSLKRTVFFGLTDIQFYALNGQQKKAIELLEKAISDEQWLPNTFWLWPPIDKDPFLRFLRAIPQFQDLAKKQLLPLDELCFGDSC